MGQVLVKDKIADLSITGTTTLELPASILTIGGQQYRTTAATACDLSTSGAGGLDTGSVAASTTYFIYAVRDSSATKLVASLDPDTTGPTGFTGWLLVGGLETDSSAEIDYIYEQDDGEPQKDVAGTQTRDAEIQAPQRQVNNLLINSDFGIWQRGTSFLNEGLGNVPYFTDRFYSEPRGTAADLDFERVTDVPDNRFKYSMRVTGNETNDILYIGQRIEADNIRPFIGKTMTLSFYIKASMTGAGGNNIVLEASTPNLGEDTWDQTHSYNNITVQDTESLVVSTSWQRISFTFVVPAAAVDGLQVNFRTSTNGALNTADTLHTTGWMLHEGHSPVDFQRAGRNIQDELAMCQRYFEKSYNIGDAVASTGGSTSYRVYSSVHSDGDCHSAAIPFKTWKRTTPTVTLYNSATGTTGQWRFDTGISGATVPAVAEGASETDFQVRTTQSDTTGEDRKLDGHWGADSEL